ncbi:MAG: hypothetical protein PHS44_02280 [Candidatus Dojkabacteria bacterium]|nr:hypothetical protein [Candidatus Dojkabacteria bacterium]
MAKKQKSDKGIIFLIAFVVLGTIATVFIVSRAEDTDIRDQAQTSELLNEDFDQAPSSAWQPFLNYWRLKPEQWYWENGSMKFDPDRGGKEAHDGLYMYENQTWEDINVEARIKGYNAGLWLKGKYEESDQSAQKVTGYYVVLRSKTVVLNKIQTEFNCTTSCGKPQNQYSFNNPTEIESAKHTNNPEQFYNVKVEFKQSNIKVYIDNALYIDVADTDFPIGTVGFKTYEEPAEFDSIKVTRTSTQDNTPPVCSSTYDVNLETFQNIRIYLQGQLSSDPESGIKSGSWEIFDKTGTKISQIDELNGFVQGLEEGYYTAKLRLTNGSDLATECTQKITVYSVNGFSGTVSAQEVDDYVIPSYSGKLYADNNPKRAIIISWPGKSYRFVFWHECAYSPYWEFPDGKGMNYQFFEGAHGSGELYNKYGRLDKNSYPEIIHNSSKLAIVKWWYYDVNMDTGERVAYAEEYFYFFPNGLVLREMLLHWGYSFEPMEFIMMNPVGRFWWEDVDKNGEEYHMSTMMDIYGGKSRDHWATPTDNFNKADSRAEGAPVTDIEASQGILFRAYFKNKPDPYILYGDQSLVIYDDILELDSWWHYPHFVHGTIGWINSEEKKATLEELNTYPTKTPLLGTNHEGMGPYFWLLGVSDETNENMADIGRNWLENPFKVPCKQSECNIQEPPQTSSSSSTTATTNTTSSTSTTTSSSSSTTTTTTPPTNTCSIADIWSKTGSPDGKIDGYDLSFLLANWKFKEGKNATSQRADIWGKNATSDGNVNSYDLSKLLSCFKASL